MLDLNGGERGGKASLRRAPTGREEATGGKNLLDAHEIVRRTEKLEDFYVFNQQYVEVQVVRVNGRREHFYSFIKFNH